MKKLLIYALASLVGGGIGVGAASLIPLPAEAQSREPGIAVKYITEPVGGCTFVVFVFPNGDYEVFPTREPCVPPPPPLRPGTHI